MQYQGYPITNKETECVLSDDSVYYQRQLNFVKSVGLLLYKIIKADDTQEL